MCVYPYEMIAKGARAHACSCVRPHASSVAPSAVSGACRAVCEVRLNSNIGRAFVNCDERFDARALMFLSQQGRRSHSTDDVCTEVTGRHEPVSKMGADLQEGFRFW